VEDVEELGGRLVQRITSYRMALGGMSGQQMADQPEGTTE
jgi:hypothetical protein